MNNSAVDQGENFGKWKDNTSKFMYDTSLRTILPAVRLAGHVGDFGGGNGLLEQHLRKLDRCSVTRVTAVDIDEAKKPDVVADITTHARWYDVVWCRYVMHYLTDRQVMQMIDNANTDRVIVVQFTNECLRTKYGNSDNETKHFRTARQLESLLPAHGTTKLLSTSYLVCKDFYKNRLGIDHAIPHTEQLNVYEIIK
mgnify:CR=1 FL=1